MESAGAERVGIDCKVHDITHEPSLETAELIVTLLPFKAINRSTDRPGHWDLRIAERCINMIDKDGIGLIITTPNYLTAPLYVPFREQILETLSLDAVIELPRGSIEGTGLHMVLLVIRNGVPRNAGTFLGTYTTHNPHDIVTAIREGQGDFFVPKETLRARWDRNFHHPRHQILESSLDANETRRITEFGQIFRGRFELRDYTKDSGEYLVLKISDIREGQIVPTERSKYVDDLHEKWFNDIVLRPGDVVISLVHPTAYVYRETDPPAVISHNMVVLATEDNDYVATYLNTPQGRELFTSQAERHAAGVVMQHLSPRELENIRIPILPLEELNKIGDLHIATASPAELEILRTELLRVKHQLEFTEAELARERATHQDKTDSTTESLGRRFFEEQFGKIDASLKGLHQKVDDISHTLLTISSEIGGVKDSSRDDEEKLAQIGAKLDHFMETSATEQRALREFVDVVRRWLFDWNRLEPLTQKFLPSAEQIYDLLQRQDGADYSPFIIQYCRALENEILTKLFHAYHNDLSTRKVEITELIATARDNEKTRKFAINIERDQRRYTLGEMSFIMALIAPGGSNLTKVSLLQDFRNFAVSFFDERVAEKAFLNQIKRINESFRVKSAHPYFMSKTDADQCMKEIREALLEFLDAYGGKKDI